MGDIHRPISVQLRGRISYLVLERGTLHAFSNPYNINAPPMAMAFLLTPGTRYSRAEAGFSIRRFCRTGQRIVNFDEVGLVENGTKPKK